MSENEGGGGDKIPWPALLLRLVEKIPVSQLSIVLLASIAAYALTRSLNHIADVPTQRFLIGSVVVLWFVCLCMVFFRAGRSASATHTGRGLGSSCELGWSTEASTTCATPT